MGRYSPAAGVPAGTWQQLDEPPVLFISCLYVQLELVWGDDVIKTHWPASTKAGCREDAGEQLLGGGCVLCSQSRFQARTQDGVPKRGSPRNGVALGTRAGEDAEGRATALHVGGMRRDSASLTLLFISSFCILVAPEAEEQPHASFSGPRGQGPSGIPGKDLKAH